MKRPRLLVRVDGGPQLGLGHAMRMIALGEAWSAAGGDATFVGRVPDCVARRAGQVLPVEGAPGSPQDATETRRVAQHIGAAWIAADGYAFSEAWQRSVRGDTSKLLVVDDNAENGGYAADAVLNVNVHATEALYVRRESFTRLLLGPRYALIRNEFTRAQRASEGVPTRAVRWLVTMGGADPSDVTGRFLEEVARVPPGDLSIEVLVGEANPRLSDLQRVAARSSTPIVVTPSPPDVSVPMRRAELALSASGGTVWELGVVGVPAAVLTLAANQQRLASTLANLGAVKWLGDASEGPPRHWLEAMHTLAADPERRSALVSRARENVDGHGAARVVQALREVSD